MRDHPGYERFPEGFFDRVDETPDGVFYDQPRLVTHIDDRAIGAVGDLYAELGIGRSGDAPVVDLMSSWISHFHEAPSSLAVVGMNADELSRNPQASAWHVHDLNEDPDLSWLGDEGSVADVVCCVSVDYLNRPLEVFESVWRLLRPGGRFVHTFSNRCFPTKAIRGWGMTDDAGHVAVVQAYFSLTGPWTDITAHQRTPPGFGDPLFAVWAAKPEN